jgi:2-dehydropantoate 2-reductase
MTAMRISMLQDVLRGRPTDVEETLGYVVRRGAALGVAVPLTRFAYGVIRGVEAYL